MARPSKRAFTLIELLMVVAIITVLVALLTPSLSSVWDYVSMMQCMTNLNRIWTAQQSYRADRQEVLFAYGPAWTAEIKPYAENQASVLNCPLGPGGGGGPAGGGIEAYDFSFDIYDGPSFSHLLWNVKVDSASQWVHVQQMGGGVTRYSIEDLGWTGSGDDWCDIVVDVKYLMNMPFSITFIQPKNGSQGYRFDLIVGGKVAVHNIDDHKGETAPLIKYVASDYAISRGAFLGAGLTASRVDGKLFFALDYVKTEAVYNRDSTDQDLWDKYFILDPQAWEAKYHNDTYTWKEFQALRHFGKANVLFCDGHIDTLGPEDLDENNSLWRYAGQ